MVHAYWLIGREIVEVEQHGKQRAGYGEDLMNRLAERLTARFGKGFGPRTLYEVEDMSPPFFADGPSGDLVAASFNLQSATAAMSGIVEMYDQRVHSLNSQFREQNAAICESAGG